MCLGWGRQARDAATARRSGGTGRAYVGVSRRGNEERARSASSDSLNRTHDPFSELCAQVKADLRGMSRGCVRSRRPPCSGVAQIARTLASPGYGSRIGRSRLGVDKVAAGAHAKRHYTLHKRTCVLLNAKLLLGTPRDSRPSRRRYIRAGAGTCDSAAHRFAGICFPSTPLGRC